MKVYVVYRWNNISRVFSTENEARNYVLDKIKDCTIYLTEDSAYTISSVELTSPLDEIHTIVSEWAAYENHDRCFWYPELLTKIAKLLDIPITGSCSISRSEFAAGCKRFQAQEFGPLTTISDEYLHSE